MNKPTEAIILAGGFGTRLAEISGDLPKPMVPIAGRPFLEYLLDYCIAQGVDRVVLSTGHRHEVIEQHFGIDYKGCEIVYQHEKEPLGTGGGIKYASERCQDDLVWVLNGDSFFDISFDEAWESFREYTPLTLCLKRMHDFDRYGSVDLTEQGVIKGFYEKKKVAEGLINAGVYILDKTWLDAIEPRAKFSFEQDIMEKYVEDGTIRGIELDGYFIDIGIPEDYNKAQDEFKGFKY